MTVEAWAEMQRFERVVPVRDYFRPNELRTILRRGSEQDRANQWNQLRVAICSQIVVI
ncbi:hypothetical protein AWB78_08114 [Caballeronia calidae]|uniref:Uncharacterized protein n=1 Tax=Caballeronia calidae TaxID=1777139 RepID=A0A158EI12_9BURK|nr:hypothetical protein AWB78_08114 [Caballeronia calidae]